MRTEKGSIFKNMGDVARSQNQRKEPRKIVYNRWPVQLAVGSPADPGQQKTVEALATDLSVSGIGLCTAEFLDPDTQVVVVLAFQGKEHRVASKVVWCYKVPSTGRILKANAQDWRMGLKFELKTPEEVQLIAHLVQKLP